MILSILFWVLLVISALGAFAPAQWTTNNAVVVRVGGGIVSLALFVIIGLKVFPLPLK